MVKKINPKIMDGLVPDVLKSNVSTYGKLEDVLYQSNRFWKSQSCINHAYLVFTDLQTRKNKKNLWSNKKLRMLIISSY